MPERSSIVRIRWSYQALRSRSNSSPEVLKQNNQMKWSKNKRQRNKSNNNFWALVNSKSSRGIFQCWLEVQETRKADIRHKIFGFHPILLAPRTVVARTEQISIDLAWQKANNLVDTARLRNVVHYRKPIFETDRYIHTRTSNRKYVRIVKKLFKYIVIQLNLPNR